MAAWTERNWDHERDLAKHDIPLRLEPKPPETAIEVAVLVQAISLAQGAELIESYARAKAAADRLDAVAAGARP